MQRQKQKRLDLFEQKKVWAALDAAVKSEIIDGVMYAVYAEGASDDTVATQCGVPVQHVAYRRNETYGSIRKPAPVEPEKPSVTTLDDLSKLLGNVEPRITLHEIGLARIERQLAYIAKELGIEKEVEALR